MGVFKGFKDPREAGRKGGLVRSEAKTRANRINPLKTGKFAKDPEVIKMIQPTAKEKLMGITNEDKLLQLKKLNPLFASRTRREFLGGVEEFLGKLLISALRKEKEGKPVDYEYARLTQLSLKFCEYLYGKVDPAVVFNQQNVVQKISLKDLHDEVMQELEVQNEV